LVRTLLEEFSMHLRPQTFLLLGTLASVALLLPAQPCRAQNAGTKVRFVTVDSVEIAGTFYPATKKDACVMLLHALGKKENSRTAEWTALAQALNAEGYAVLSFDFRGHGDSTAVTGQKFWSIPTNRQLVLYHKNSPDEIKFEDFKPAYYPALVNDIAAAKGFLDRKNDAGQCNTSALIVIGAETGGTLGAIWMNSEWYRYQFIANNPLFPQQGGRPAQDPEGKGTIAGVFLTISPKLGNGRAISLEKVLNVPGRIQAVPMAFMYGQGDASGEKEAKKLARFLKATKEKHKFIDAVPVAGAKDLKGQQLLQPSLGTDKAIIGWLDNILENKTPERITRDYQKSQYAWVIPTGGIRPMIMIAKPTGELNLLWNNYERFMPR
jgi:hypothetical protein